MVGGCYERMWRVASERSRGACAEDVKGFDFGCHGPDFGELRRVVLWPVMSQPNWIESDYDEVA